MFILVDEAGKTWVELSSLTKSGRVRVGRGSTREDGVLPEEVLSDEDRLDDMFALIWMGWNSNWCGLPVRALTSADRRALVYMKTRLRHR